MELNFKEDLVKFNSAHAKLLYMIYYFYMNKELTRKQKSIIKSHIISDEETVFCIFEEFEDTHNEKKLLKEFLKIYHSDVELETPRKRNKDEHSFSHRGNLTKIIGESSRKNLRSKLSFVNDRSFLNKTTVPFDSCGNDRFGKFNEFIVEEFSSPEENYKTNKKQSISIKPENSKQENLNIIFINNNSMYACSPLNRAYRSIAGCDKGY